MLADQLRSVIALGRPAAPRHGFDANLKAQVVAFARQRREAGAAWHVIAESVGLSSPTVRAWCKATPVAAMVRVQVVADGEPAVESQLGEADNAFCLVSPRGYAVKGLNLEQLVDILGRVG